MSLENLYLDNQKKPALQICDEDDTGAFGTTYTIMCNIANFCENCSSFEKETAAHAAELSLELITSDSAIGALYSDCQVN